MAGRNSKIQTALESALASLSRRQLTEAELLKKLRDKGFSDEDIAPAVERCKGYGYVNDTELVKRYAAALARERKLGSWAVARKLELRGFSKTLVEGALADLETSSEVPSELERAKALASKKFRGAEGASENREKLVRFLRARGFEWEVIRQVFEF